MAFEGSSTRATARVVALAAIGLVAPACAPQAAAGGDPSRVTLTAPAGAHGAHMQIVRPLKAEERVAIVQRFRERNGAAWTITLGSGGTADDVDAIRGVVRRAKREDSGAASDAGAGQGSDAGAGQGSDAGAGKGSDAGAGSEEEAAIAEASAFLGKNAEFFGIAANDVPALDVVAGPAKTTTYGTWVVHFRGRIPMRGFEGFEAVASMIDVLVYVAGDGSTRYFVNLSHVHPQLVLDTSPLLGPDDKRVLRVVVGFPLFVLVDDPNRPNARARELRRVDLGRVEDKDVRIVRLIVHVSPALRGAYVSYWLAYEILVVKGHQPFRFVVDADTGELLEDPQAPIVPASSLDEIE